MMRVRFQREDARAFLSGFLSVALCAFAFVRRERSEQERPGGGRLCVISCFQFLKFLRAAREVLFR